MGLRIIHEGNIGPPYEHCCICDEPTPYWYGKGPQNVALCPKCTKKFSKEELPTKDEWCKRERLRHFL